MNGVLHAIVPSSALLPACGAPFQETCSNSEAVVTCAACRDIIRVHLEWMRSEHDDGEEQRAEPPG